MEPKPITIRWAITSATFLIIIALVVIYAGTTPTPDRYQVPINVSNDASPEAPPPMTDTMKMVLTKSVGFSQLVSYTDRGFEPATVTIHTGESVRFTNNSHIPLWIASISTAQHPLYPGQSPCGGSTFDSCVTLQPKEFWEFTFTHAGTWGYQNNVDNTQAGMIHVI